jgi:hypothetical protein
MMPIKRTAALCAGLFLATIASAQTMAPKADHQAPANDAVKHPDVHKTAHPASGANSFTEGQARERIAKAGYAHVSALKKDDAGLWQGTATKGGRKLHVALDYKGDVSSK